MGAGEREGVSRVFTALFTMLFISAVGLRGSVSLTVVVTVLPRAPDHWGKFLNCYPSTNQLLSCFVLFPLSCSGIVISNFGLCPRQIKNDNVINT